jgi:spoIIIJ-associated protein
MLEQGRRGLLGLGVKNVRIRVKPPIDAELPEEESKPASKARPRTSKSRSRAKSKPAPQPEAAKSIDPVLVKEVEDTVRKMTELMGLKLDVSAEAHAAGVDLLLKGQDQKSLVAKNADLLGSIQFLLNRMSRRSWPGVGRINVGCPGHARPRDQEIVELARKVAKQVSRTGHTKKLKPMNAYERRIVHLAVREFAGLTSSSDGSGALKRIRISKVQNQI